MSVKLKAAQLDVCSEDFETVCTTINLMYRVQQGKRSTLGFSFREYRAYMSPVAMSSESSSSVILFSDVEVS